MSRDVAQVYRTQDGLYWWRIRAAGNNEIIAQGESYEHKQDILDMLEAHFPYATIIDLDAFEND